MIRRTWDDWASVLLEQAVRPRARMLIDGRSGSGKSTLASHLVSLAADAGTPVRLIALEDIYPGWDGLAAASNVLATDILGPMHAGIPASWQTWDWHHDSPGVRQTADIEEPIVVEGAGALTRASAALATWTVWVEAHEPVRQSRAFARDGDLYRPHWNRWAAQEEQHLAREQPQALADLVIDANLIDDPAT